MATAPATIVLERRGVLDVSAASGCVVDGGLVHVIADDDLCLRTYDLSGRPRGSIRLFAGALPAEAKARKRRKPDLEALVRLPDGSLLALGSGSSPARHRGARVFGDGDGPRVEVIDLAPLHAALAGRFDALNLEGAAVVGPHLVLAQRGNGPGRQNALVRLDLAAALAMLDAGRLGPAAIVEVVPVDLGELDGVPLSLTDLARGPDGLLCFAAAAEATDDPYLDGACAGSAIGVVGPAGEVARLWPVAPIVKIEGLACGGDGDLLLVADADDPAVMAPLFGARLPG